MIPHLPSSLLPPSSLPSGERVVGRDSPLLLFFSSPLMRSTVHESSRPRPGRLASFPASFAHYRSRSSSFPPPSCLLLYSTYMPPTSDPQARLKTPPRRVLFHDRHFVANRRRALPDPQGLRRRVLVTKSGAQGAWQRPRAHALAQCFCSSSTPLDLRCPLCHWVRSHSFPHHSSH